jgi:hypothetical protein
MMIEWFSIETAKRRSRETVKIFYYRKESKAMNIIDMNTMTKEELTELVMKKTHTYKKTNLMKMLKADLIEVAKLHLIEATPEASHLAESETEQPEVITTPSEEQTTDEVPEEFKAVEVKEIAETEKKSAKPTEKKTSKKSVSDKPEEKPIKERLNDTEKLMLQTIPQLPEFKNSTDSVLSKDLLAKMEELHKIPISTTRALLVSLKKKEYLTLRGKRTGLKQTTIWLGVNGLRFLGLTIETESA